MAYRIARRGTPIPKKEDFGDRLAKRAAEAALQTGFGVVQSAGEKVLGNVFRQGGAAEMALTPQSTLDARAQAAEMAGRKTESDIRKSGAQTAMYGAQRDNYNSQIADRPEKRALDRRRIRVDEAAHRLNIAKEEMDNAQKLADSKAKVVEQNLNHEFAKIEIGLRSSKKGDNDRALAKLKAQLKKTGKTRSTLTLPDGRTVPYKTFEKKFNATLKISNNLRQAGKNTDEITEQLLFLGNMLTGGTLTRASMRERDLTAEERRAEGRSLAEADYNRQYKQVQANLGGALNPAVKTELNYNEQPVNPQGDPAVVHGGHFYPVN